MDDRHDDQHDAPHDAADAHAASARPDATGAIADPGFAKRLANLLADTRRRRGLSVADVVRLSDGALTRAQVKELEEGVLVLDESIVDAALHAYGADLEPILPSRVPVVVDAGVIATAGIERSFDPSDPDSLLTEYLRMVRDLRRAQKAPVVDLRRADVEALADYLHEPQERVLDRLLVLMGATRARRISVAALFASGAVVIGLVGGAAAVGLGGDDGDPPTTTIPATSVAPSSTVAPTTSTTSTTTTSTTSTTIAATTVPPTTVVVTTAAPTTQAPVVTPAPTSPPPPPQTAPPATQPPATPAPTVDVGPPPTPPPTPPATTVPPGIPLPTTTIEFETGEPPLPPSIP